MEIVSQVSLDSKIYSHPENASIHGGDPGVILSNLDHVNTQQPVLKAAKKTTRQWAAWTRQEEESFFTALRQVGKNFEKITQRVQSKNKDQVRHYYYRLVRRMNKLLGPGLCLDAKNSKDTNAAMLRWWSLLEKYSCKASKLHLKPRRFKIFIEALENQLLKDRKKNVRKRPSQGEKGCPTVPSTVTNHSRALGHDARTVKLVLVDNQNIQKLGAAKGSLKRNVNMGIIRSNNKGDLTVMKPPRQRRKQGVISSAAYKKWEKAAIAGVSLVADAAEHLERTTTDNEVEHDKSMAGQNGLDPVERVVPPLPALQNNYVESGAISNVKLKLQLFPIDDSTRRALEMEQHNPHLELTLSTRKKISSVLEHLNRKWGNSSVASGELMLFPYTIHRENLVGCQRWTQDSIINAADVYTSIGSPPVFRLRYGWFSNTEFVSVPLQVSSDSSCVPGGHTVDIDDGKQKIVESVSMCQPSTSGRSENIVHDTDSSVAPSTDVLDAINGYLADVPRNNFVESSGSAANLSWQREETNDKTNMKQLDNVDDLRLSNGSAFSAGEWADSLTNISVGDLLSKVPPDVNPTCTEQPVAQNNQCLQQVPFSCDSFDAAIAAHTSKHLNKIGFSSTMASHASSIWDAEETCDAFSYQKNHVLRQEVPTSVVASPEASRQMAKRSSLPPSSAFAEELSDVEVHTDYPIDGDPKDECPTDLQAVDNLTKDFTGLTDIFWPDSLGPLDLDIRSSKYHSEDLILSDSLSDFNRLITSSLDAFQNCSFFGGGRQNLTSTVEGRETASFSDFKVGGSV